MLAHLKMRAQLMHYGSIPYQQQGERDISKERLLLGRLPPPAHHRRVDREVGRPSNEY